MLWPAYEELRSSAPASSQQNVSGGFIKFTKIQASLKEDSPTPTKLFWDEVTLMSKIIQVFMLLAKAMIGIAYKNLLLGDLANRKAQPGTTKKHPENIVKHSTIE